MVKRSTLPLKLLLAGCSALVGIFLVELALFAVTPGSDLEARADAAREVGREFDTRSRLEVVDSLRQQGIDAWPTMKPYLMLGEEEGHDGPRGDGDSEHDSFLFPLGGIAESTSVYCNEGGAYAIFQTDEHGFRNPVGSHSADSIGAVIIGDSFGNGACVQTGEDPAALLSEAGSRVVSLASPGNGPLIELATLAEYGAPLEPPVVLWFYFEGNDLKNLSDEMRSDTLRRYLERAHSQNLRAKQAVIDVALRDLSNEWEAAARAEEDGRALRQLRAVATLYHLRRLLGWDSPDLDYAQVTDLFCRVIERAHSIVKAWGGRMAFVYLPSWYRYVPGRAPGALALKGSIESCVESEGIPMVDFASVLASSEDPLSFFSLGVNPHYNEAGYERLAEAIRSELAD